MLPQRNAHLTRVERIGGSAGSGGGGWTEDYDRAATDPEGVVGGEGDDLFTGKVAVYFEERRERVQSEGGSDRIVRRSVIFNPRQVGVTIEEGDRLTLLHAGAAKSGKVKTIEARAMPGVRPSTRATFEDG